MLARIAALQEGLMPKFVIEREVPGAGDLTDAQLQELSNKSVSVLKGMGPEIQWLHSYVTGDKVYCVYLATDESIIKEHARRVGIPANRISAVRRLIDPVTAE
jgi:Nickel responsive protein SCO4226-like